jgi:hypothetical protein
VTWDSAEILRACNGGLKRWSSCRLAGQRPPPAGQPDPARPRWLITERGMGYRFHPAQPDLT